MLKRLEGVTLALLWPRDRDERACAFTKELAVELTEKGAQVFNVSWDGLSGNLLKVMGVQALLGFTAGKGQGVRFIYSRRKKEESFRMLSFLAKELFKGKQPPRIDIAGIPGILGNGRYFKFSLLPLPAVLIETDEAAGEADYRGAVMGAVLSMYGQDGVVEIAVPMVQGEVRPVPGSETEGELPLQAPDEDMEEAKEMEAPPVQEKEKEITASVRAEEPVGRKQDKPGDDRRTAENRNKEKKKSHKKINTFNPPGGGPVYRFVAEGLKPEYQGLRAAPGEPAGSGIDADKKVSWEELCQVADTVKKDYSGRKASEQ